MSINISAMLIREDKETVLNKMSTAFGIILERLPDETWGQHHLGYSHSFKMEQRIMVYAKGGSTIIYGDLADLASSAYNDRRERFLKSFPESAAFDGSETSMVFSFRFYEKGKSKGRDVYSFDETFIVKGKNLLKLGEDDDMIFDGLFPLVDSYVGETAEEDPVEIYRQVDPDKLRWDIQRFAAKTAVPDGCAALIELRNQQATYERLRPGPVVSAPDTTDMTAFLKTSLWQHAELWERSDLSKVDAVQNAHYRGLFASLWVQQGIEIGHERFHALYLQIKEIIHVEVEPQPYERITELMAIMRDLMALGYFYNTRHAEKLNDPQFKKGMLASAQELADRWQDGLTGTYSFRCKLQQVAQYLAWANLSPEPKKWWKFW